MSGLLHAVACIAGLTGSLLIGSLLAIAGVADDRGESGPLRAGAAAVDVSPRVLPVEVNGGFLTRSVDHTQTPLHARAVVFERGGDWIALVVVDSCMLPRDVCDAIKQRASAATGIPSDRMLVAATHTHSAPSAMDYCLGTMRDDTYTAQLIPQVVEAIIEAHGRLEPALVGATAVDAWNHTHCRRWITRSDTPGTDPFGGRTVRAMMHPNPISDYVGPAGPVDPALSILSVVRPDGRPIAVVANFSMHYLGGVRGVSPDYFGPFSTAVEQALEKSFPGSGSVAMMSQGTSGDLHRKRYDPDHAAPEAGDYAAELAALAIEARGTIRHTADAPLAMAQTELTLSRRLPDAGRLAWADRFNADRGDRRPTSREEVYAMQARWIHEHPQETLVLQAARIGDLAITALPNEVYGITGLKLKRRSPLPLTMNIELANGAEGYIPPPEQHVLGGYTTWPARTAGLEVEAEPRIVAAALGLLEKVADGPGRTPEETHGPAAAAVVASKPVAFWRMNEMEPPRALDAVGAAHGRYEDGVAFFLPGVGRDPAADMATAIPEQPSVFSGSQINRAPHFAGGRMHARLERLPRNYAVSLWLWNGFPVDVRPVTGHVFSRGAAAAPLGDHLGIGGTDGGSAGRLIVSNGQDVVTGRTPLGLRHWHHVVLVRDGDRVRVHLDGRAEPDVDAELPWTLPEGVADVFVGGRCDGVAGFEGKIDEVAVYDRPFSVGDVHGLYAASARPASAGPSAAHVPSGPGGQPALSDQAPLGPEEALRQVFVPAGFRVELAAAEPVVLDPVAFDWDASGRLWVVEMGDYPLGLDGKGQPGGRIRVLADTNGDGRYDSATLFAEGLNFPTGCLTWRDGVIVTAAPEILFLADTDGDGRADRREVLVEGLAEVNQQLRPNGLRWGLDNWIYVASGSPGGAYGSTLRSRRTGATLAVGSHDFRFRPDTGELEAESGPTQFGRNRDDWGHWVGTQNAKPLWHYVFSTRYVSRNPHFAAGRFTQPLLPADVAVHPAQPPEKRYHNFHQAGHYTSACSGMIHRDPRLCGRNETVAFVCEPFHNLVQRVRLEDAGVSFTGTPVVENGRDFLTSTDRWFRPVMVRTGPDGGLWVADMYRFMIEHPDWLPPTGKDELLPKYRLGDDRGRIYRVVRVDARSGRLPDLHGLDGPGLVGLLASDNGFLRDKASQMLIWKGGDGALPALRTAARDVSRPLASLHALAVLDGLGRLTAADVAPALAAGHPGLRENALQFAEGFLRSSTDDAGLLDAVVACAADETDKVRFQAALSLGESSAAAAGDALARLMVRHAEEPFMLAAIMSSAPRHAAALAAAAVRADAAVIDRTLGPLLRMAFARDDDQATAILLATVAGDPGTVATSIRVGLAIDAVASVKTDLPTLAARVAAAPVAREASRISDLVDRLLAFAERKDAPSAARLAAASAASRSPSHRSRAVTLFTSWLSAAEASDVQQHAVRALAATGDDAALEAFAAFWPESSPALRPVLLDAWLSRDAWALDLLGRIRAKEVAAVAIDPTIRARLSKHRSKEISKLAVDVLGGGTSSRAEVIERYRPALGMTGDPTRGLAIYRRACATCHRHEDEGKAIGPDVRTFAVHAPEKLLANILDPSSDIQPGYHAFVCALDSGEQLYGIVTGENAGSINFLCADATERTILRSRIESLRGMNVSLMPEGLEAVITPGEMADLIAFLRQPKQADEP
jgi:putative membrane-bound dehydrogenase-like protein